MAVGLQVGYVRVSSADQNPQRQQEGLVVDRIFTDHASGKDRNRPALAEMLAFVREGDTVVVHSMDRLARNVDDLRRLVQEMTGRGVRVRFVKENLIFAGEGSPMAQLMLTMLGAVAQFERDLIRERQREGIELAKKRGVYRRGRRALNDERMAELQARAKSESKAALAREFGISRETVYQYLRAGAPE
ncbi:MAG: recombinase family protein [Planctomycetes bacterium]|nr:recombinase family protein [Planctomycetota bacterium]